MSSKDGPFERTDGGPDLYVCGGDCGSYLPFTALQPIASFFDRVAPGEECPAGECPRCGALAHPVDTRLHHALEAAGDLKAAVDEAHERLTAAGIPDAAGARCNDSGCQTKLGHRVKLALERR